MLQYRTSVPDDLLNCDARAVHEVLGGPTLFFLEGQRKTPLFVTVLQHGNEPTGFDAVQVILRKYLKTGLPRSVWLFVANTAAASIGQRVLAGQPDFNRCWPGAEMPSAPEVDMMADVVRRVTERPLFASVDLHNNTGCNPHYGCVNKLDHRFLQLATLFSRTVVYFTQPKGVQSLALSPYTPAVTLECGQAGEVAALDHAIRFLDACLHLHHLPDQRVRQQDIHLLHTVATVKTRAEVDFGFEAHRQVNFRPNLDHFNFGAIQAGEAIASLRPGTLMPVEARDNCDAEITNDLFELRNDKLLVRQTIIPSMATTDIDVVRQDCLFYVMEEIGLGP